MLYSNVEIRLWMGNYIPLFYIDVIAYPYANPEIGLANLCQWSI